MIRQRPLKERRYHYFWERSAPSLLLLLHQHHHSVIRPHRHSFSLRLIPPLSSILPPISSLLSLYFPPIASGSHAALVCFLFRYMWVEDKPPQWAGLSDSRLHASTSLSSHYTAEVLRSHWTEYKKTTLGFCRAFFFFFFCKETKDNDEQTSKNIKAIIMITTNRLSGAAVNTKGWMNEDVQAAVNK